MTLVLLLSLQGCGLVGRDGYGRPVPCPREGKPAVPLEGDWSCVGRMPTLKGTLPANAPQVAARLAEASRITGGPVAYTDGTMTQTHFPAR
jgi:hypothetical protein